MIPILAEITATEVGTIIGAVIIALISGGVLGKKTGKVEGRAEGKAEAMQIGPQPFMVELKEAFVTRREFDKLELTIAATAVKTEASIEKFAALTYKQNDSLAKRLVSQSDRLSKQIEQVAGGAYQGRQRIHVIQNEHTAQIAELRAHINVAKSIEKLAEVLTPQTKVQPTHPHKG